MKRKRGIVLLIALLAIAAVGVMGIGVALTSNSDMMINGYYRNFNGSFYAADAGVTVARQQLVNQVLAAVPATFSSGAPPLPAGTDATVAASVLSTYGAAFTAINTGAAANSWPGSFKVTAATLGLLASPAQPVTTATNGSGQVTGYQYTFNYALTAQGQSQGSEQVTVTDSGSIVLNATITPASAATMSFASWGMFIDASPVCSGSYLVAGTISGPVFTNGAWNFGTSGSYIFTDTVGSNSATAGFQFGSCISAAASSYTSGGTTIKPAFQNGFYLGQPKVSLPTNDFSQKRAVLDGLGTNTAAVSNANLNAALRDINGTAYPSTGAPSGVYMPYQTVAGVSTVNGGGIYIEGDAAVTLSTTGTSGQIYTVKQGSTTTTITIDNVANTTKIVSGAKTTNLTGVPKIGVSTPTAATMLYVNGNITALTGPGQGVAAVQDGTALTITAASNVTITGDILYKTEPVTLTQNQIPGTAAGTLISGNNKGQTLGIFTTTGNVNLANTQGNGNLEIDASIATISQSGSGGITNTGNSINTLTIVGGRIQNQILNIGSTTRNVFFDRRYSTGFGPPWFPSTSVIPPGLSSATVTPTVQRVMWYNTVP